MRKTKLKINQGTVKIGKLYANVVAESDDIVAITVSLNAKCSDIEAWMGNGVYVFIGDHAELKTNNKLKPTLISFPEFKPEDGWSIHCSDADQYRIDVCLAKKG